MISISELTLETWLELQAIEATDEFDRSCQIISILRDIPLDEVLDMPADEANEIAAGLTALAHSMSKPADKILILDEDFYPIPFEGIEFGAFIDLESLFQGEYRDNVAKILAILYRRQINPGTDLEPPTYELYEAHFLQRADLYMQVPVRYVHGYISRYIGWRDRLLTAYEGLFGDPEPNAKEEGERLTSEEAKAIAQEERVKKWSWQLFLWKLSGEDPLKMEEATRMPVLGAMNILSMMQELKL